MTVYFSKSLTVLFVDMWVKNGVSSEKQIVTFGGLKCNVFTTRITNSYVM